ncbi:hypothetical protein ACFL2V_12635 [Pseudomonadota bacterium]
MESLGERGDIIDINEIGLQAEGIAAIKKMPKHIPIRAFSLAVRFALEGYGTADKRDSLVRVVVKRMDMLRVTPEAKEAVLLILNYLEEKCELNQDSIARTILAVRDM